MKLSITNAAFAAGVSILVMAGAHAGTAGMPQVVVHYSDLNLSSQDGAQALITRLNRAADKVCGGMPDRHQPYRISLYHACTQQAVETAVTNVDSPVVSAMYGDTHRLIASK